MFAQLGSIGVREVGVVCLLGFALIIVPFLIRWLMSGRKDKDDSAR